MQPGRMVPGALLRYPVKLHHDSIPRALTDTHEQIFILSQLNSQSRCTPAPSRRRLHNASSTAARRRLVSAASERKKGFEDSEVEEALVRTSHRTGEEEVKVKRSLLLYNRVVSAFKMESKAGETRATRVT